MRHLKRVALPLLLVALVTAAFHAGRQSAAPSQKTYDIENSVNEFDMKKTEKTDAGYQYWFAD